MLNGTPSKENDIAFWDISSVYGWPNVSFILHKSLETPHALMSTGHLCKEY